jgi:pyridoxine 5-phosphate synthase
VNKFREEGIRTSIFIDASVEMAQGAAKIGTDRVELYTEPYATQYSINRDNAITPFIKTAMACKDLGLGLNAGHDLSLENLKFFHENIPWLDEVSIGHALICDALYLGLNQTIEKYLTCLK